MESVIGLRFSAIPSPSVRIMPSGFHAARAAKSHLRLSFSFTKLETTSLSLGFISSLSLSRSSRGRRRLLDGIIGPVCCKPEPSPPRQSRSDEKRQQEQQLRDMVQRLLQSQPRDLANRLKSLEPIVKENVTLSDQIIDIVNVLKESEKYYNLALKLLKTSEQFIEEEDSLATIRFKIMEILYSQGQYQQAFDYWIRLCEMKSHQMRKKLFTDMQCELFSTMTKVLECLKESIPSNKDISPDFLRSMNDLKDMDIPELMNIRGGGLSSIAPGKDPGGH